MHSVGERDIGEEQSRDDDTGRRISGASVVNRQ